MAKAKKTKPSKSKAHKKIGTTKTQVSRKRRGGVSAQATVVVKTQQAQRRRPAPATPPATTRSMLQKVGDFAGRHVSVIKTASIVSIVLGIGWFAMTHYDDVQSFLDKKIQAGQGQEEKAGDHEKQTSPSGQGPLRTATNNNGGWQYTENHYAPEYNMYYLGVPTKGVRFTPPNIGPGGIVHAEILPNP